MKYRKYDPVDDLGLAGAIGCFGFLITMIGAWATHVIWIIDKLQSDAGTTAGQMLLGILGSVIFPVGCIHGVMLWIQYFL